MSRANRQVQRAQKKAQRRANRKRNKRNKAGRKAGSIAIHSRLPGLEGTLMGAMDVVVDTRRQETHAAEISITIHNQADAKTFVWSIETGFGGAAARAAYQVFADGELDEQTSMTWLPEPASVDAHSSECLQLTETP